MDEVLDVRETGDGLLEWPKDERDEVLDRDIVGEGLLECLEDGDVARLRGE